MPLPFWISSFLSEKVTAILLSGVVKVVLMCMTLTFLFFPLPLTFAFPFTVVNHNTLLLNLSAGLDSWFYLCFHSSLINTLLASSELKTRQKKKKKTKIQKNKTTISDRTVSYFVLHLTVLLTAQFLKPGSYGNAFTPLALLLEIAYCFICLFILVRSWYNTVGIMSHLI